jgi:hypothetical protein
MPFDEEMSSAVLKQILHFLFAFQWYGKEHLGRAEFCVVDGDFRFADCTIFLVVDHTRVVVNVFVCHPAPALSALCAGSNPDNTEPSRRVSGPLRGHEEKSQAVGEIELPRGRSRPIREHTRITPPPISHY